MPLAACFSCWLDVMPEAECAAMRNYLFFETRSKTESHSVARFLDVSIGLSERGRKVDLVLMQNAAFMAVEGICEELERYHSLETLDIWVDKFSLESRGLHNTKLLNGIHCIGIEEIVTLYAQDFCLPVWH